MFASCHFEKSHLKLFTLALKLMIIIYVVGKFVITYLICCLVKAIKHQKVVTNLKGLFCSAKSPRVIPFTMTENREKQHIVT